MSETKEEIIDTIRRLPDDASIEDAVEALILKMTIEQRLRDLDAGIYIEHDEVRRRFGLDK